jgi:hypothetical protein
MRAKHMSRMPKILSARHSLFMYVHTHPQLQYYFKLSETSRAANQNGILGLLDSRGSDNIVEIHPIARLAGLKPLG